MKKQEIEKPTKFERIFEDEECKSVWKYDLKKQPNGPISVEYSYRAHVVKAWEMHNKRGR
jgi:hypothetical protein